MGLLPVRIDVPFLTALPRTSPLSRLGIYAVPAPVMFCALRHKTRQVLRGWPCDRLLSIPALYPPIPPRCHARCLPIGSTGHANAPYAECLRKLRHLDGRLRLPPGAAGGVVSCASHPEPFGTRDCFPRLGFPPLEPPFPRRPLSSGNPPGGETHPACADAPAPLKRGGHSTALFMF